MSEDTGSHYPQSWRFDQDGSRIEGRFIRVDEGRTDRGPCGILVLDVSDQERSVWLFHEALRSRVAQELARRGADDFVEGERVVIEQGAWRESRAGYRYRSYLVEFPDAPRRNARSILGEPVELDEDHRDHGRAEHDPSLAEIPF